MVNAHVFYECSTRIRYFRSQIGYIHIFRHVKSPGPRFSETGPGWPKPQMGVSENSVPLNPMVNDHYPYEKWLFHWEYTLFSDKPKLLMQKHSHLPSIPSHIFGHAPAAVEGIQIPAVLLMDEPADVSMSAGGFWGQLKSSVKIKVTPNTTGTFGGKLLN